MGTIQIMVQCPKCNCTNITQNEKSIWCNQCKYKVEDKLKDLDILMRGGGEITQL